MNHKVAQRATKEGVKRMNDVDERKDKVVYLRMSDHMVKTIKQIAALKGMGLATWCRASLLTKARDEQKQEEK